MDTQQLPSPDAPTLFDLVSDVKMRGRDRRRGTRGQHSIIKGLKVVPFRNEVGYRVVSPEELASLHIPVIQKEEDGFEGYQRRLKISHAFNIAWALDDGQDMPVLEVSLDELGTAYITDGQHRAIGALIARKPLRVAIRERSFAEARQMFINQTFAKRLDKSHMVLVGTDAMSEYVQDALTNAEHPWSGMVHETNTHKLTPSVMHRLVLMYGCDTIGGITAEYADRLQSRFNSKRADELADLIGVFGRNPEGFFDRRNNSLAFKQTNLSALAQTAVHVLIRADNVHPGPDRERWLRHMPLFNWTAYMHLRNVKDIVEAQLDHWNKHMTSRRVERRIYNRIEGVS